MPLFDRTIASKGLSKNPNMADFQSKQTLQYSGAYFTHDPREKDAAGFTPWSNSNISLLDGRSPASHHSGIEGQNHNMFSQDSKSSEEGHSHSSSLRHTPIKQSFTLYNKGAGIISPTAASVDDRKQKTVGENSSPPSEDSVYLAFPKPVYGQTPCCNELGCVLAQRYSVEHGCPRIPNTVFEHEWMQTDAPNAGRPSIQRKSQNTLLQQRDFQFESSAEQLKRANVKMYSPGRARTLPAMIQPTYSGYPCTLTHTLFGPLSEQSQRLQTSPRGYTSLYPSHPTYEHMTSEVYQEHSPMSKYGQLTQHPMFYYPQANVEVEKRTLCKDIGIKQSDVPVILKHTIPTPPKHYIVPQNLHGEITLPSETLANQSFMRGFDYACYAVPRLNINASQMRTPLKRQHTSPRLRPNRINVSASRQFIDPPMASSTNTHKDKAKASLYVDLTQPHSPVLLVDKTSPYRRISQPVVSPSNIHMNRYNPPLRDMRRDHTVLPPNGLDMDRPLDYSFREARVTCLKQSEGLHVSTGAWLARPPHDSLGRLHTAVTNGANFTKNMPSPAVAPENEHNGPVSSSGTTVLKGHMKRSFSHSSSPIKIKEEYRDLLEVELVKKRQKLGKKTDCPPMPVIGKVFSLAPYQAYLQASGVLFPGKVPQRTTISSEHGEVKTMLDTNKKRPNQEELQQVACLASREICTPAEKPIVKVIDPKNIKVEKVEPSDTDNSVETPRGDCSEVKIKKEPEETDSSNSGPMLVIKKCEPDELESKPLVAQEKEISAESKPGEVTALIDSSSQGDTCTLHKQGIPLLPKPITPPQAPERKLNFKNIPPQCLKLSTYKIVLRDTEHCSPAPPPELITKFIPKLDFQMPVRKHFLELHQSLCKLLSESVLASSEQELKNWLSQLKLTEPASPSNKVPKVSCLLGQEARRVWLSEEMKTALNKLLQRLREYTAQDRCPFPHVMRTGAVFLPMLVVKELLFPLVQGSFIDQVLQEHKVELRPTTLSEEKILIQLHKRACSSKLRRLMSLRHLPDIYPDVVNLLYYTCVCKHLGLEMDDPADREKAEGCEGTVIFRSSVFSDNTASPASPAESRPEIHQNDRETKSNLNKSTTKSRVKSSSRRLFLDDSLSGEEEADDTDKAPSEGVPNVYSDANWSGQESDGADNRGSEWVVSDQDSSLIPLSTPCENSWTCPIALDELSPSPSDTETEASSSPRPVSWLQGITKSPVGSNNSSGVILKLRRIFSKGLDRKKARYQANCDSGTFADPSLSQTDDREGEMVSEMDLQRRTPKVTHRWQRTGRFTHTLRPLSGNSKRKRRSLLKIKYCPYLSACHSAEHRRRWVLRSAVQRAQRAMRFFYPDLVGKKIRHLYEEDDKSEVWYRGEVLRIHEANANPLKTLFEVRYDSEPEWKYYLELLIDYKKGWLKIED